jgi:hypothetical protein
VEENFLHCVKDEHIRNKPDEAKPGSSPASKNSIREKACSKEALRILNLSASL